GGRQRGPRIDVPGTFRCRVVRVLPPDPPLGNLLALRLVRRGPGARDRPGDPRLSSPAAPVPPAAAPRLHAGVRRRGRGRRRSVGLVDPANVRNIDFSFVPRTCVFRIAVTKLDTRPGVGTERG